MKRLKHMTLQELCKYYADKYYKYFRNLIEFDELVSYIYIILTDYITKPTDVITKEICINTYNRLKTLKKNLLNKKLHEQPVETIIYDEPEDICINYCLYIDTKESINKVLNMITDREALVIKYRFGLENNNPRTLLSIGKELGLSGEAIRQIEYSALRKLRHKSRNKYLTAIDIPKVKTFEDYVKLMQE